ncbi:MAG: ABC transporter ATP-binding protein [Flavobacteriales bacterium]
MIDIRNISKTFGSNAVLKNVTASFLPGKVNFIIGRSGSGKSVMTKCMVGLMGVDSGEIDYDGRIFNKLDRDGKKEIRQEMGMLFQGAALFTSMTVEENVMFPLKMLGNMSKSEMSDRVNECLKRVNLEGKNQLYPSEISGGMQKRTGIARAIALNPKYLFCDEPNSGLDPQTSIVIDNLIRDITQEFQSTTVVISHDMNSVIEIGDNIHFLHQGALWWKGNKKELLQSNDQILNDFVFPSDFMKAIREQLQ